MPNPPTTADEKLVFLVTVDVQYYSTSTEHPSGREPSKEQKTRAAELFQTDLAEMLLGTPADAVTVSDGLKDEGLVIIRCTAAAGEAIGHMRGQTGVRSVDFLK